MVLVVVGGRASMVPEEELDDSLVVAGEQDFVRRSLRSWERGLG